jgi:arylsulfatase A-like enzyme
MMTTNRSLLHRGALAAALTLSAAAILPAAERPNILFIFTDDHCVQATSAYGSKLIQTPNMDRIADGGMRFDRCYVTNSICGPSRACIQTGKYSHVNGFMTNGNTFNGDQQTFPKLLRTAGYQTAIVGKWHLKSTPQGFDYYDVLIGQGPYNNPPMLRGGIDSGPTRTANPGYTTTVITDKAVAWLKNDRDPKKPFMLMYQHKAPHRNWMPDEKYQNWLDDVTLPEPETLWDDYKGRTPPASRQTMSIRHSLNANDLKLNKDGRYAGKNAAFEKAKAGMTEKEIVQWKYQRYVKDYLRCVRSVDDGIGRVLDYLDASGLAENTVVIYSSDQGWYLGDHGWFDKRWMYEESLKTPLLIRWPGVVKPGSVNDDIVSNIDFAQTFLALAGVKEPGDMHGRSLVPVLKGETPDDWRKSFYYHYYEFPGAHAVARHYGVTTGRHKLIHFYGPSHVAGETYDEWELFDLEKDPNEMTSVYDDPEYAEVRKTMHQELRRLRAELAVPEDTRPGRQARPKKEPAKKPRKTKA